MKAIGPRAQQKLDTRERVRAAAWELFTGAGYEETTTRAVAERAGVASGTVFLHARDKADLLCLVMHARLSEVSGTQLATLSRGCGRQIVSSKRASTSTGRRTCRSRRAAVSQTGMLAASI